jgi:hypothetical protein
MAAENGGRKEGPGRAAPRVRKAAGSAMAVGGNGSRVVDEAALAAKAEKGSLRRLSREEIASPELRRLVEHWDRLRGERPMPERAEIRPEDLAFMLGRLMLVEVHRGDEGLAFRFRLVGTLIEEAGHRGLQGRWAHELQPDFYRRAVIKAYSEAATGGAPNFYRIRYELHGKRLRYERVTLPLAMGAERADMLLVGTLWEPVNRAVFESMPALRG